MLTRYGSLLFALPAIILIVAFGFELMSAGQCTDAGLHYDYTSGACSDEAVPQLSYYQRNTVFINVMLLLSMAGALAMTWGMLLKGMQPSDK
jgi:hypothetical protein